MCLTCGCADDEGVRVSTLDAPELVRHGQRGAAAGHPHAHDHPHDHDHAHGHGHDHDHPAPDGGQDGASRFVKTEKLVLEEQILAKNDHLAARNRSWLLERDIPTVNLMSSPGSGKTSLLERTIAELGGGREICVIEGDQETLLDAERIRDAGARAVQINTGAGCHLDAPMVQQALEALEPSPGALLFIENVGNLVCPALFDVGERAKVVVISVTEGEDKPLKYPHMFAAADLVIVNKTDLLPYVDFDLDKLMGYARSLNPGLEIIALSVRSGDNMGRWYEWLTCM
ncbi:MAG: hydrogenase nickel incorporation protein HypB [Propionibacteriales bacterium]|nr:hydrogenase nickel incorporation protein HypB [Propionibacteriales bacterium]